MTDLTPAATLAVSRRHHDRTKEAFMPGLASTIGRVLRPVRPGLARTACARLGQPTLSLSSAAFTDGGAMDRRFTADGAGLSVPLQWSGLPPGTASVALLVEDADAPFPRPLVHLVLYGMPPTLNGLAEGAVAVRMATSRMFTAGRNSFGRRGWLPPSPVPGHGPHRYTFQLLALSEPLQPRRVPGRGALMLAVRRACLGYGRLIGTYERA